MKNKFVPILIALVILFLIVVAVYKSYTPNSKIQKTAEAGSENTTTSESLTENAPETASDRAAISSSTTETAPQTAAPTTEEKDKNLPTLKLIITEGPVIIPGGDLAYYRVGARVTGTPAPFIKFSRDDSGGAWGKDIAQINLKSGESYDLVVTVTNASGSVKRHIVLTWNPTTTDSL